jgi:hypothetical protein
VLNRRAMHHKGIVNRKGNSMNCIAKVMGEGRAGVTFRKGNCNLQAQRPKRHILIRNIETFQYSSFLSIRKLRDFVVSVVESHKEEAEKRSQRESEADEGTGELAL